ncbi:hypothetical protein PENTCL1PPCAC_4237, partial [Pristionchus entomophagus]
SLISLIGRSTILLEQPSALTSLRIRAFRDRFRTLRGGCGGRRLRFAEHTTLGEFLAGGRGGLCLLRQILLGPHGVPRRAALRL